MLNIKNIVRILGVLLLGEAIALIFPLITAAIYGEDITPFIKTIALAIAVGGGATLACRGAKKHLERRDGFIIVSLVWVIFSFIGMLPFIFSGAIPSVTDAFFETMSGFTTTGSSILNNIEELPKGILFWRSMTQWLGGMGIIVLSLAVLPMLGVGGMKLFAAEVPGPTPDKLSPRLSATARMLWGLYLAFTVVETIMLYFGGMDWFDAINHSFTTMATGGYSTKQASVAYWDSPYIQYVITFFMIIAGTNFTISYFVVTNQFKKVVKNEEFRWYLMILAIFTLVITLGLYFTNIYATVEEAFRISIFQVASLVTTTGYATADYLTWTPVLGIFMFLLFFVGGSSGSTGGGIKVVRIMLLFKNGYHEFKRLIHPNAVVPVRIDKKTVGDSIVLNILAFFMIYIFIFAVSVVIFMFVVPDLPTSVGAVATSLGNIGPGLGSVGPADNFSAISDFGKWFLSLLMLVGRLELFTVLVIFTPAFWKD